MAVDAHHLNLFHSQLLSNKEIVNSSVDGGGGSIYDPQMAYAQPFATTVAGNGFDSLQPMYNSLMNNSMIPVKTPVKSVSGLTYNNLAVSRKRSRDSINPLFSYTPTQMQYQKASSPVSFLGEDLSLQLQQQQFDVHHLVSQHMEKVRLEIEEKRKTQTSKIVEALEQGMMKRLKAKEEQIEKISKLNWALEERVKSLWVENQIWRDLAQTNEATANALRTNLEQILTQVKEDRISGGGVLDDAAVLDDAQSCCGSNYNDDDDDGQHTLAGTGGEGKWVNDNSRWCRECGKEEACVLLLPCRHLCLCTLCGSSLHVCPICKSTKNASLHVNMS